MPGPVAQAWSLLPGLRSGQSAPWKQLTASPPPPPSLWGLPACWEPCRTAVTGLVPCRPVTHVGNICRRSGFHRWSETHVVDGGRQPCLGANLTWDFFGLSGPRQLLRSPPAPVLRSRSRPCATGKRQFLPLGGGSGQNPGVSPKPFLMTLAAPNLSADLCAPHSSPRVLSPRWGQLPAHHHLPVLRDHFTSPMKEQRAHSWPQCWGPSHFRHYLTSSSQPSL